MLTVVSPDLKRLAAGARVFPTELRAGIRRNLAVVARDGANASKAAIRGMPAHGPASSGLRADGAAAVRVAAGVNTVSGASARIYVAQTGGLAAHGRYHVLELMDDGAFRHPVFGHRKVWANQSGYPWFKQPIERKLPALEGGMHAALTTAVKSTMPNVS